MLSVGALLAAVASGALAGEVDCLAGLCLGSPANSDLRGEGVVAGMVVDRIGRSCSGQLVSITAVHNWILLPAAGWTAEELHGFPKSMTAREVATADEYAAVAGELKRKHSAILEAMVKDLGWSCADMPSPSALKYHICTQGSKVRIVTVEFSDMTREPSARTHSYSLTIHSGHPDEQALCKNRRTQGL